MKVKTLKKKILRLEKRLKEGPGKLAKLKRKMAEAIQTNSAQAAKEKTARTAKGNQQGARGRRPPKSAEKTPRSASPAPKARRKLNLSPERRAALSAAMKARWAARKASIEAPPATSQTPKSVPSNSK